jgi:hypothetical protein
MTIDQQLTDLGNRWTEAEVRGDSDALDALAAADFTLVGPLGFVLDRNQWVNRFRGGGGLDMHEMTWDDVTVRQYGSTAVAVGVVAQRASFQGNPADGRFRVTQIAVQEGDRWLLAGLHYSPIAPPPTRP